MQKTSKTDNHAKAPQAAEFVEAMRAEFGEIKVMYVEEGEFKTGTPWEEKR